MSILLLAHDQGVGSCWLRSINRPRAAKLLGLPEGIELDSVIALGRPAQEAVAVDLKPEDQGQGGHPLLGRRGGQALRAQAVPEQHAPLAAPRREVVSTATDRFWNLIS